MRDTIATQDPRSEMARLHLADAAHCLSDLAQSFGLTPQERRAASLRAEALVDAIRDEDDPGLMEVFLAEYGLSSSEGVALMCLAEALLRVPDAETIDALIEDKIAPSSWGSHLGQSSSTLVNASTWALMLTGTVLRENSDGIAAVLKGAIKRLGEPVIRAAVGRAMRELGHQFVLGRDIAEATQRAKKLEAKGVTFSYDMLGEAAMTGADAQSYFQAYSDAISAIAAECRHLDIRKNPGISIKLSALHPRYDELQRARVMTELVATTTSLARQAAAAGMGLNIDAEEAERLDLSLDVIEQVLGDEALVGWDGFGVVVQAYGKRAPAVIDWLHALAKRLDRKIMVRLVKGAYWDTEIKRAQIEGSRGFPVFTRKVETDISYLCCARKLLGMTDRIYPQFATHNAHSMAAILEMATDKSAFEFQRLQGMGEALHRAVRAQEGTGYRIYAPVGAHRDLLAYLVRRLLENGANSSFVNQIVDKDIPASEVAQDPFEKWSPALVNTAVTPPSEIFAPRRNSRGWDVHDRADIAEIERACAPFQAMQWALEPISVTACTEGPIQAVHNPAKPSERVGQVRFANAADARAALTQAKAWAVPVEARVKILRKAVDLYEKNFGELFSLLQREAGKTRPDCVGELREAVDFLRYYADQAMGLEAAARGVFVCISPWNFPLAIFTGQIAAALAAGNGVVAKPAEATSLIAIRAAALLHEAGVPKTALQILPGEGAEVGVALTSDPRIDGVCFTGSTVTAHGINRAMAEHLDPFAPLIAETGGLNAMIVDSTALPQQAIRDIVISAFQSAGQRCSALRVLYLQSDVADEVLEMLYGAMDELSLGDPGLLSTDIGPLIDQNAQSEIKKYISKAKHNGAILKQCISPSTGHFMAPTVLSVPGIEALEREVFGPVLHVARFQAHELDQVVDAINASGYGLTFGMHSRIDDRVEQVTARLNVGNIYINRNQIGAIVGAQPFGGEALSGTGPKAGGPNYVARFTKVPTTFQSVEPTQPEPTPGVQTRLNVASENTSRPKRFIDLPGPTGESNRLEETTRGPVLCLGPGHALAAEQARIAREAGTVAVMAPGLALDDLRHLTGFDLVAIEPSVQARLARQALAKRDGPILPLASAQDLAVRCRLERHICIDTTAAGGNTALLAAKS